MSAKLLRFEPFLAPSVGALFAVLWINAEIGRGASGVPTILAFGAAIAVARVLPLAAVAVPPLVLLAQVADLWTPPKSTDWPVYFGIAFIVFFVVASGDRAARIAAAIVVVLAPAVAPALMVAPANGWTSWTGVFSFDRDVAYGMLFGWGVIVLAVAWLAGLGYSLIPRLAHAERVQRELQVDLERSAVDLAVEQERNRIAQEVHDVVAHSLAVIVAQADGARYVRTVRPEAVDTSLLAIADAARTALDDVRGLVDEMIDGAPAPAPTAADVPALVEGMRAAGLAVEFRQSGEPAELSPAQHLALYRILQESLTNAMRHRGRESSVAVALDWTGPGVAVTVASSGGRPTAVDPARAGRGIASMRERARGSGGWLAAGPEDDGGYLVTAFLPYRAVPEPVA